MKSLFLFLLIAFSTVFAQSVITVDTLDITALESIPDLADIANISPMSTASRIVLNSHTDCTTVTSQIQQAGYKVVECI